jgi:hypothetical protein
MRRLLPLLSLVVIGGGLVLVYSATGGLRLELLDVQLFAPPPPEPERIELRLLYQNAAEYELLSCRWTPPGDALRLTEEALAPGDGTVVFELGGTQLPRGRHRVDFLVDGDRLLTEQFELPPAEPVYETRLTGDAAGLRAAVHFRHQQSTTLLRGEWRYAGDTLADATREVELTTPHGVVRLALNPPADETLPPGEYRLLLYADDAFLAEYEYRLD